MCGPLECLPCQSGFVARFRRDRVIQVWTVLWVPFVVLWLIYFGFQIDDLASAVGDRSSQVIMKKLDSVPMPSWTICNATGSVILQVNCTKDAAETLLVPTKYNDGCFGFNAKPPLLKATHKTGKIDCVLQFADIAQSAQVFLHDPIHSANIHDPRNGALVYDSLKQVPNGICVADVKQGTQTFFWWRYNRFEFLNGDQINSYSEVSSSVVQSEATNAGRLRLEVGDYYEWKYKEVQWWSGYDFWSFMGMVGGASFLLLMLHTLCYYPLKHFYADRDSERGYVDLDNPHDLPSSPSSSSTTTSGTSPSVYDSL